MQQSCFSAGITPMAGREKGKLMVLRHVGDDMIGRMHLEVHLEVHLPVAMGCGI